MRRPCSCTTPFDKAKGTGRRAYGWQRDGGHAEYMIADESTLVKLPEPLTYLDGAMMACGYGTAYSAVLKAPPNGRHSVLVVGLGPVGLAVAQICLKMGSRVDGYDASEIRRKEARQKLADSFGEQFRVIDDAQEVAVVDHGCVPLSLGYDFAFEAAGAAPARVMAIKSVKRWGTVVFIGGYGQVTLDCSPWVLQKQLTLKGSWTCSVSELELLAKDLKTWNLHPDSLISHTFSIKDADKAYELFDSGACLKVAIVN